MFILVNHPTGRAMLNVEKISIIVEHNGKVYITSADSEPTEVLDTYEQILEKLEKHTTVV